MKTHKYMQVAEWILQDVCDPLAVGAVLPFADKLRAKYKVSDGTLHKAFELLVRQKVVKRIPRKGTVLLRKPGRLNLLLPRQQTLTVLSLQGRRFDRAIQGLADKYAAVNPAMKLNIQHLHDTDALEYLKSQTPDLVLVNEWWLRQFITDPDFKDAFLPLSEVRGLFWDPASCFESVARWCRNAAGELMSVPLNFSTVLNCFNTQYPGAALPSPEMSLTDFMAQLQPLRNDRQGRAYPFLFAAGENRWPIILRGFGAELFSPDGRQCLLDTPAAVRAIRYLAELMHDQRVCRLSSAFSHPGYREDADLFALGRFWCAWVTYKIIHWRFPFPIVFAPLPVMSRRTTHLRMDGLMIPRHGAQLRLVRDFMNYLLLPESQWFMSEQAEAFSCNRHIASAFSEFKAKQYPGFEWFIRSLDFAEPVVAAPRHELISHINRRLDPVWMGIEPAERVCREIAAEICAGLINNRRFRANAAISA